MPQISHACTVIRMHCLLYTTKISACLRVMYATSSLAAQSTHEFALLVWVGWELFASTPHIVVRGLHTTVLSTKICPAHLRFLQASVLKLSKVEPATVITSVAMLATRSKPSTCHLHAFAMTLSCSFGQQRPLYFAEMAAFVHPHSLQYLHGTFHPLHLLLPSCHAAHATPTSKGHADFSLR